MKMLSIHPSSRWFRLAIGLLVGTFWSVQTVWGQTPSLILDDEISSGTARLHELRRELIQQERQMEETRGRILAERERIEALLGRLTGRGTQPAEPADTAVSGNAPRKPAAVIAQAPAAPSAGQALPDKPVGQAPAPAAQQRPPEVAQIFQSPGVLTPVGKIVLEPSLQYAHANDNRVAIVGYSVIPALTIGLIDVRRVSRDIWTGALTTRFGITNRMEVEARLPYVYRNDSTVTRALNVGSDTDQTFDSSGRHLGDMEMTLRRQLNDGGVDKPYFVGSLRVKSRTGVGPFDVPFTAVAPGISLPRELPTGSGFWGIAPGITALLPSDPVVLFGGISYLHSFSRDVSNGFGRIRPGPVFNFNLGLGLALNDKATFSIGYDHSIVRPVRQVNPGTATNLIGTLATAQVGTLIFGLSYRQTATRNLNFSIGLGATRDAPDVQLTLRMPMTF